jgi:cysteine desulfurase
MIYLDNSSTTKPYPSVVEACRWALEENFGNPSSLHRLGLQAEKAVKEARENVAALINVSPEEIVFTSGGTEGNYLAIRSVVEGSKDKHIITSVVEHPSVMAVFEALEAAGWEVDYIPVDKTGHVDVDVLKESLRKDTVLVSIMAVNNELGTNQPISEIGKLLKDHPKTYFHVDAVQAVGKVAVDMTRVDLLTMSAHKIHGPKGIGALYVRRGRKFESIMPGGGQERGFRGGTENVPAIVGFGEAAKIALKKMPEIGILKAKRDELAAEIKRLVPDCTINSPAESVLILNVSFPNIKAEVLLHALEEEGIYVSTGSACSSRKKAHPVLVAIGLDEKLHDGTIRFDWHRCPPRSRYPKPQCSQQN